MRSDIHVLFDLYLIKIDSNYVVRVAKELEGSEYANFDGCPINLPAQKEKRPSVKALEMHFKNNVDTSFEVRGNKTAS